MDILFVKAFDMGVAGVAWATFLCQGISCILAVVSVLKRLNNIIVNEKCALFDWDLEIKIAQIAIPSILQQSFISIGNILIQSVINSFGASVMAGYSAAIKLNNLVITSFSTIGNGISNFTAQNLGAKQFVRIKEGFKAGLKMVWMFCVPFCLLYILLGKTLLLLFMEKGSTEALLTGQQFLWIVAPFYFVVSAKLVADGILRGIGAMWQFMVATFTDLILRVVLAFVFSGITGSALGIWCAWPVGWSIAMVISVCFYHRESRKLMR